MKEFSHVDQDNNPTMVDITDKSSSFRRAVVRSKVWLPEVILDQFVDGDIYSKKGPVFQTAIIAGVMGLKKTSELIPFCHQLNIEGSKITIELVGEYAEICCSVNTFSKTGVEMEAFVGAQIAALTIYDMCKVFSHEMRIEQCCLCLKSGGKRDIDEEL